MRLDFVIGLQRRAFVWVGDKPVTPAVLAGEVAARPADDRRADLAEVLHHVRPHPAKVVAGHDRDRADDDVALSLHQHGDVRHRVAFQREVERDALPVPDAVPVANFLRPYRERALGEDASPRRHAQHDGCVLLVKRAHHGPERVRHAAAHAHFALEDAGLPFCCERSDHLRIPFIDARHPAPRRMAREATVQHEMVERMVAARLPHQRHAVAPRPPRELAVPHELRGKPSLHRRTRMLDVLPHDERGDWLRRSALHRQYSSKRSYT